MSTVRRINETLRVYFTLEELNVFIYMCLDLLSRVHLGATPIP